MRKSFQDISTYYFERFGFKAESIQPPLDPRTKMIIVIPVHNEPSVTTTLDSLDHCTHADSPVEVILVVNNSSEVESTVKHQNSNSIEEITKWTEDKQHDQLTIHLIRELKLPPKHAGVGLARKIGMDEALKRFTSIDYNGLIVCLDADCTVHPNYLRELKVNFTDAEFISGNVNYEHIWSNEDDLTKSGIIKYELGLRYYVNALRYAGYPYAYHTIGSSMAVSAQTYAQAGGMNKRKAGEDFYFLHKLIPLGGFRELNSTTVYPSSRVSERVPFGTGRAMLKWKEAFAEKHGGDLETYNFKTFQDLKGFISMLPEFRDCVEEPLHVEKALQLPESIQAFLVDQNFGSALTPCIQQTTSAESFLKRIFTWLDGFQVLKFVHFSRDNFHPNMPVELCAIQLLETLQVSCDQDSLKLLDIYRKIDTSR